MFLKLAELGKENRGDYPIHLVDLPMSQPQVMASTIAKLRSNVKDYRAKWGYDYRFYGNRNKPKKMSLDMFVFYGMELRLLLLYKKYCLGEDLDFSPEQDFLLDILPVLYREFINKAERKKERKGIFEWRRDD